MEGLVVMKNCDSKSKAAWGTEAVVGEVWLQDKRVGMGGKWKLGREKCKKRSGCRCNCGCSAVQSRCASTARWCRCADLGLSGRAMYTALQISREVHR